MEKPEHTNMQMKCFSEMFQWAWNSPCPGAQRECGQWWELGQKERGLSELFISGGTCWIRWQLRYLSGHSTQQVVTCGPLEEDFLPGLVSLTVSKRPTFRADMWLLRFVLVGAIRTCWRHRKRIRCASLSLSSFLSRLRKDLIPTQSQRRREGFGEEARGHVALFPQGK